MHTRTLMSLTLAALTALTVGCTPKGRFAKKTAKATCDRAEKCGTLSQNFGSKNDCLEAIEAVTEDLVDDCEDYNGRLAYQCLKDIEEANCDDSYSKACDDWNDECDFEVGAAIADYEGGMSVYGLGDYRFEAQDG